MSSSTCFPLFVCNSCLNLQALVSRRNKSCTKVPGIEALILSKLPLNYLSHRAGNARLTGGYQVLHCGTKTSVCSNLPPWINIQPGFSHFARLFVDHADALCEKETREKQSAPLWVDWLLPVPTESCEHPFFCSSSSALSRRVASKANRPTEPESPKRTECHARPSENARDS